MTVLGIDATTKEKTGDWTGLKTSHPRRVCRHRFATIVDGDETYQECRICGARAKTIIYDAGSVYQWPDVSDGCTCTPNSNACPTCRAAHEDQEIPY